MVDVHIDTGCPDTKLDSEKNPIKQALEEAARMRAQRQLDNEVVEKEEL